MIEEEPEMTDQEKKEEYEYLYWERKQPFQEYDNSSVREILKSMDDKKLEKDIEKYYTDDPNDDFIFFDGMIDEKKKEVRYRKLKKLNDLE